MWFPLALTFALITSVAVIIAKRVMRETGEYLYLWLTTLFTLPFLFFIVIYFYQIPQVDKTFFLAISASLTLDVFAAIFAYRAIKISEISLIAPIAAFNPVFTAIVSSITLGEIIGIKSVAGISLICIGAYLLQISKRERGWLAPFKSLLTNKGVQLSLVAYFLWAITPVFQKTAILHTTPQVPPFVSLAGIVGMAVIFAPIAAKFSTKPVFFVKRYLKLFVILGILGSVGSAAAFIAFSQAQLGLVTAVFKLSIIFTVILGWIFFKERNIKDRLLGSSVMLTGVVLLAS